MKHIIPLIVFLAAPIAADGSQKGNAWPALPGVAPVKDLGCRVITTQECAWEACPDSGELIWVCTTEQIVSDDCVRDDE